MNRLLSRFMVGLSLLLLAASPLLADDNNKIKELQAAGHLLIAATLAPDAGIVPRQKVTLTLKISTDTWFAGGTRISLPEIPGLVILQTEQFASNASETRAGKSWVVQRWSLDLYPQRAGDFTLPPIAARVKVNAGTRTEVEGLLYTPPINFTAAIPESLKQIEQWVAAPEFTVTQSFDRSLEGLQVGDAFEREIVFEASDVMAMMLPSVKLEDTPGLAAYPSPPALNNSNNRGQSSASRSEKTSYVVEAEGDYQLPALEYFWWDTNRAQLQLLSLPAMQFRVGAGATDATRDDKEMPHITRRQLLLGAGGLVLLAGLLWLAWKLLPRIPFDRLRAYLAAAWHKVADLRKPGLPPQLNPDSSAGD